MKTTVLVHYHTRGRWEIHGHCCDLELPAGRELADVKIGELSKLAIRSAKQKMTKEKDENPFYESVMSVEIILTQE